LTASADAALFEVAWTALKARRGESVTYASGSASVVITAVFTQPKANQVDGEENIVYESRSWDMLINPTWPDDAPAAFDDLEPSQGDTVTRSDGSVYQVQPSDAIDACWRYSDGQHTWRRVFVQEQ
jgi:hypothetical protein